jgi:hypothetical protein
LNFEMPGGLFDHATAVERFGREHLADAPLFDDGVMRAAQAVPANKSLNIAQAARAPVHFVLALAGAIEPPPNRDALALVKDVRDLFG